MTLPAYIDIHALQTVPYSNLNRDDLGTPKTVVYGGAERTRVSSQAWKRPVRHEIEQRLGQPAVRTRRLVRGIAARLTAQGWDEDLALAAGRQVLLSAGKGIAVGRDDTGTSALFYLPAAAIDELAAIAAPHRDAITAETAKKNPKGILPKNEVEGVLRSRNATISLLGRMLAEVPGADIDGSVQFAHAFTTHATVIETDFFTAVDDIEQPGSHGSAHMNAAQFSSGTFYRYANINIATLAAALNDDLDTTRELVAEFLRAFVITVPAGKQSPTAAMTIPGFVYTAVRTDRPVSLAPAFENPVRADAGYEGPSLDALSAYAGMLHDYWGRGGLAWHAHTSLDGKTRDGLGIRTASLPGLLGDAAAAAVPGTGNPR